MVRDKPERFWRALRGLGVSSHFTPRPFSLVKPCSPEDRVSPETSSLSKIVPPRPHSLREIASPKTLFTPLTYFLRRFCSLRRPYSLRRSCLSEYLIHSEDIVSLDTLLFRRSWHSGDLVSLESFLSL
ncbi:hypothetical protein Nepgr_011148 [Nepenthes gracilis]|uniref:Uncharacterized protein n=1 Tax=Nepenthes gracilis TaxID=150966 RepID=A0AAD3SDU4_NEPGR|nr:hypothetical protein Nepgr_011148 [Nepenthes gracilis]